MTNTNTASGAADDSLLLCASDLQHSAICDNHVEMQACIRAVANRIAALASATPQADSQPAPDERDDFEKVFPLPSGCIRVGTGYASTGYSNWAAHTHCERWQGWQARAARAPADSVTAPAAGAVAGPVLWVSPGQLEVFKDTDDAPFGTYIPARKTSVGKFTMPLFAAAPTPAAQAAPSVLEDAARLDWLEDQINAHGAIHLHDGQHPNGVGLGLRPGLVVRTLRDAIYAARKQGANHD